jgi:hypothetical protein
MSFMDTNTRKSLRDAGFIGESIESIIEMSSMKVLPQVILHKKIMKVKLKINLIVNIKLVNNESETQNKPHCQHKIGE